MSNYYAPYFYRIDFVVIPSYLELPWIYQANVFIFIGCRKGILAWNGLKNHLLTALSFKKYLLCLKYFGILMLEHR